MFPNPSGATSGASPKMAAQRLLRLLYPNPKPESPKKKDGADYFAKVGIRHRIVHAAIPFPLNNNIVDQS